MSLSGTQTEKNLAMSFAGECMARTKYTYFSEVAKKQGYEQIAAILLETAENEREHAKMFFNLLKQNGGKTIEVPANVSLSGIGNTVENLRAAAAGEHEETEVLYPKFAKIAKEEGFPQIARTFTMIAKVEKEHELRYKSRQFEFSDEDKDKLKLYSDELYQIDKSMQRMYIAKILEEEDND